MSRKNNATKPTPPAVTPSAETMPKLPDVPVTEAPEDARKKMHAGVRAGLTRKREEREKLMGTTPQTKTASDGDSDTIAKLRAEKEVIIKTLRALVVACDGVPESDMSSTASAVYEPAIKDARELVELLDAVPKT